MITNHFNTINPVLGVTFTEAMPKRLDNKFTDTLINISRNILEKIHNTKRKQYMYLNTEYIALANIPLIDKETKAITVMDEDDIETNTWVTSFYVDSEHNSGPGLITGLNLVIRFIYIDDKKFEPNELPYFLIPTNDVDRKILTICTFDTKYYTDESLTRMMIDIIEWMIQYKYQIPALYPFSRRLYTPEEYMISGLIVLSLDLSITDLQFLIDYYAMIIDTLKGLNMTDENLKQFINKQLQTDVLVEEEFDELMELLYDGKDTYKVATKIMRRYTYEES